MTDFVVKCDLDGFCGLWLFSGLDLTAVPEEPVDSDDADEGLICHLLKFLGSDHVTLLLFYSPCVSPVNSVGFDLADAFDEDLGKRSSQSFSAFGLVFGDFKSELQWN